MFFFKQMTAYEMRISDWSSDVCSSDLESCQGVEIIDKLFLIARRAVENRPLSRLGFTLVEQPQIEQQFLTLWSQRGCGQAIAQRRRFLVLDHLLLGRVLRKHGRSEEHTSELQSLMRISYAVFCLKKKKQ